MSRNTVSDHGVAEIAELHGERPEIAMTIIFQSKDIGCVNKLTPC